MNKQAIFEKLRKTSPQLSVGILTADMMNLGEEIPYLMVKTRLQT